MQDSASQALSGIDAAHAYSIGTQHTNQRVSLRPDVRPAAHLADSIEITRENAACGTQMIAARLLASRGKEELMHTPTIYMFDDPSAALSSAGEMVARARTVPERARRKAAPPAAAELQLSAERLAERNASRLAWAVATALGFAVVIGSIVGFIVSILGMLLVPEFGHSLSAGTLASIVAIVAGSALVGGLIGARAALDGSGPPAAPKLDTAARTSTGSSRFEFSEGTSPPRHSHELL